MKIEEEVRRRNKKANLQEMILTAVKLAGILAITAVAPNVLGAMYKIGILPHPRQRESILNSRKRLVKKGYLVYKNGLLEITDAGRNHLMKETLFENLKQNKNKKRKWDGKWRVLIFDIPVRRNSDREYLRNTLIAMGFMKLQHSVWIYPYDCEDLVTLLKAEIKIGRNVLYMIVEALEYDKPVRSYFGL
ncbi:MAG: hypothetical protein AAB861_04255 [Patescibacteria group bacterium]